jgi:PAS domain S-box-containing protein
MGTQLKVLIVEDSEDDTLLLIRELQRGGYEPIFERVETAEAMKAALDKQRWDIVIADYFMPHFSGLNALKLLHETGLDLPFILVSGTIGEETAVEAMKQGAHDYIIKNNLSRLIPAIERELREVEVRQERKLMREKLKESENLYRTIFETTGAATIIIEEDTIVSLINQEGERLTGYLKEEIEGKKSWTEVIVKDDLDKMKEYHRLRRIDPDSAPKNYEARMIDRHGNIKNVIVTASIIPGTRRSVASILDITERRKAEEEIQKRVKELEDFYHMAVGREIRMIELKEEIEKLKEELVRYKKQDSRIHGVKGSSE